MSKRGVLLMNIGTPDHPTIESVRSYLREFLLDPDVIDIPYIIRQLLVRGIILRVRPKKIAPRYESIWMDEGSPLRVYSMRMAKKLENEISDIQFEVGMRYGNPSIKSALEKLRSEGVEELLLAPLFPHHAQATTESSIKEAFLQMSKISWSPKILELGHFEDDPGFILPLAESIRPYIDDETHLLFSYHGLPVSHIKRIDKSRNHCLKSESCCLKSTEANTLCYSHQCHKTSISVATELGLSENQWSLSFQSRLGPAKWLEPSTLSMVEKLAEERRKLVIASPAFLADGLETLEELEIEAREHFLDHGGSEFHVVKCLNDNSDWIRGLSGIIKSRFSSIQN